MSQKQLLACIAVTLAAVFTLRAQEGGIDRAVASALDANQTKVSVSPIHKDFLSDTTNVDLPTLSKNTTPLVAELVAHRSYVEPTTRDLIVTTFLFRVIINIRKVPIPSLSANKSVPASLVTLAQSAPSANGYVALTLMGGHVTVNGVSVTMEPTNHHLPYEKQFLLFVVFNHDGTASSFGDERSILLVDSATNTVKPVSFRPVAALTSLTDSTYGTALGVVQAATR